MPKTKKSIEEKVREEFPEFVDEVQGLAVGELIGRLANYAKEAEGVEDAKESDEALHEAKESATSLAAPYRDAKKAIRLKSRYVISLLKDRGES